MRLVAGLGRPGYRHYFFEISENDLIAFFEWSDVEPIEEKDHGRPVKGPFAFDHVSIGVENEDDLWDLKDKLVAAGFWVSEVIDHGFIHSIYAHDPNGIPIEFSHNVEGINIRKNPGWRTKRLPKSPRKGPSPSPANGLPFLHRPPKGRGASTRERAANTSTARNNPPKSGTATELPKEGCVSNANELFVNDLRMGPGARQGPRRSEGRFRSGGPTPLPPPLHPSPPGRPPRPFRRSSSLSSLPLLPGRYPTSRSGPGSRRSGRTLPPG